MAQPTSPPQPDGGLAPAELLPAVPVALLTLARLHRLRQQALAARLVAALRRFWALVDPGQGTQASWDRYAAPGALMLVTAVQAEAARGTQDYVTAAVEQWGAISDPVGTVVTSALAGVAADGRPLAGLLSYPAFEVDAFIAGGMDRTTALTIGQRHLERIAVTEVQDAARVSTGVAMVNDRAVRTWVRMLNPPSCSRCVVLAGKVYKTAAGAGFQRHPLCDCVAIPSVENVPDLATDPKQYFDSLDEAEQDRVFTKAGAEAIRDGADIGRVVNARRKGAVYTAGGRRFTREATTRRGTGRKVRLMPESIYAEAGGNRAEAIRLLKLHGYVI